MRAPYCGVRRNFQQSQKKKSDLESNNSSSCNLPTEQVVGFNTIFVSGMLAPPREKQALLRPAEIHKTRGAKLTIDYTDYAHTFGLRVGK